MENIWHLKNFLLKEEFEQSLEKMEHMLLGWYETGLIASLAATAPAKVPKPWFFKADEGSSVR